MAKLDVNFFKPFVEGTLNTLKVQCNSEVKTGKPFFKETGPNMECDIAGIIGLTSSAFNGTISLNFPKSVFLALMEKMLGEPFTDITPDLQDGAAELLNIIFGHAKRVLNSQGYEIQKAIPSIVRGKSLDIKHLTKGPILVLPFVTEHGEFQVEICTENTLVSDVK